MPRKTVSINSVPVRLHPAAGAPGFREPRVLSSDPWSFVALWLRRKNSCRDAEFYWNQAWAFFRAANKLPQEAAPLVLYYCFLNAAKTLLVVGDKSFSDKHGVGRDRSGGNVALKNEGIKFGTGGVFPRFSEALGKSIQAEESYSLQKVLYNIPFIHRAYCLTYSSATERFFPLRKEGFIRDEGSKKVWFQAEIPSRYNSAHLNRSLPDGWEKSIQEGEDIAIRRKKRFLWKGNDLDKSIERLVNYHRTLRNDLDVIYAPSNRWYLRKKVGGDMAINHHSSVLVLAAMHCLSELCRYNPKRMKAHFDAQHNFLISEFVKQAPSQFVHAVASEITGREFLRPDSYGNESK